MTCKCEEKVLTMKVVKLDNCLGLPEYKTVGSAGMDLYASIDEDIVLGSLERTLVPTGIKIELPLGYEAQIRPRSGKAIKDGISLVNAVGTIDSDFRNEVMIPVINLSRGNQIIRKGERIAQMIIARYERPEIQVVAEDELSTTERGLGGFGSTGSM